MKKWLSSILTSPWMTSKNKKVGYIYEQAFFTEALRHDLDVFTPLGDYLPVDCLVQNMAGRIYKIQIKGSSKPSVCRRKDGTFGRYKISTSYGRTHRTSIDCTKVDVVACFCAKIGVWYLIPCLDINNAITISLSPDNPDSKGKHEKYLENWDIFKTA